MGVGSILATENISGGQMSALQSVDTVGKSIQNEISSVQRQMQELSSKSEIPAEEKMIRRQELQQQISKLNAQLRQHQSEVGRERRRELLARETRTDGSAGDAQRTNSDAGTVKDTRRTNSGVNTAKDTQRTNSGANTVKDAQRTNSDANTVKDTQRTDSGVNTARDTRRIDSGVNTARDTRRTDTCVNTAKDTWRTDSGVSTVRDTQRTDTGVSTARDAQRTDSGVVYTGVQAVAAMDSYMEQVNSHGRVIARAEGNIAILKSEIHLDEMRGQDVKSKQAELAKQEERVNQASVSRLSTLGSARQTMNDAAKSHTDQVGRAASVNTGPGSEGRVIIRATNYSKERGQEPQFYTSV